MAGHRRKAGVDLTGIAGADPIDGRLHVVEDPAPGHTAQNPERLGQCIEQHLVGMEQIGAQDEDPTMRELRMRNLQLDAFATEDGPILAPVELEGLAGGKDQGHEGSATAGLGLALSLVLPGPDEGCKATV